MNNLYDPDRTGIGHQPLGFDEYKAMGYTKYRVFRCDYEVDMISNTSTCPVRLACVAQNATQSTFLDEAIWETNAARNTKVINLSTGGCRFKGSVRIPGLIGMTNEQYRTSPTTAGLVSGPPTEVATLAILADTIGGSVPCNIMAHVRLKYYAELFDPSNLGLSVTKPGQEPPALTE